MTILVESDRHRIGEHCASTALRNLLAQRSAARLAYAPDALI